MWRIGIAVLIGQCCVHSLSTLPALWPFAFLLSLALIVACLARSILWAAVLFGVGWAWGHAQVRLNDELPSDLEGQDLVITGYIASMLEVRDVDPQFDLDVVRASDSDVSSKLRLAWYDTSVHPQPGELWQFVVRLKRRNGFANPGGFDYEGLLFRFGIGATGYVRADERNTQLAEPSTRYWVLRLRAWLAARIAASVGDSRMLGVLQGLAVGDTQSMLPEQWRVFAATGTSHLMAISGLHISMVAALAALLGRLIVRIPGVQQLRVTAIHGQTLAGIAAAVAYSLLAGMSVPTQRTLVMLCIYFAARWCRREVGVANALGLALLGVLIIDPFAALSIGAWLSFGAVAIIVIAVGGRMHRDGTVVGFARVQWAVTLGLLPILIIAFGSVSLISPLANAFAVPLFTLVLVPLVLFGTLCAAVSVELGSTVLGFASQLLDACWPVFEWLARQPLAMWYLPNMPVAHYVFLGVGALLFVLPTVWPLRIAATFLCVPALVFTPPMPTVGDYELSLLDVGQGLAVVVRTRSHTLVYDAGPSFRTGRDTGELVVLPYLRSRGVRWIDRLVISHGDLDHQGGMQSLLTNMSTRSILLGPSVVQGPSVAKLGDRPERCTIGQQWSWDGVLFEILHPGRGVGSSSDNDTSCVVRIVGRAGTALLTGDIEAEAERELLERGVQRTDIVVIAHHGSRSSSTEPFVTRTSPKLALVSAGYRNRWNFPRSDVTQRWRDVGAQVESTIESGAIAVSVAAEKGIVVRHYRREHRRYWSSR
jgi:competence protein ComEC